MCIYCILLESSLIINSSKDFMKSKFPGLHSVVALSVIALGGCGGGGGGGNNAETPAAVIPAQSTTPPDGLYAGTTNTGRSVTGLVLDDGSYYLLYTMVNNPAVAAGLVQGTGSALNGSFISTNARDINFEGLGVQSASISTSYNVKQSLIGSLTYSSSNSTTSFTTSYDKDYELTPSLAVIVGTYQGSAGTPSGGSLASLTVTSTGAVSGTSGACNFTGTVAPRPKGNAFNASIRFSGSLCQFNNATLVGGAYFNAEVKRLFLAGVTSARDSGVIFIGSKP
jgi:hypothetical protein